MELKNKLKKLKEMTANNDENAMAYLKKVSESCKTEEDKKLLQKYAVNLLTETSELVTDLENDIDEFNIKEKLGELTEIINFSYIARVYFNKSKHWLYQRINNYNVNGKPAYFTDDEKIKFNNALNDIKNKITVFTA